MEKKIFSANLRDGLYYVDVKVLKDDYDKEVTFRESSKCQAEMTCQAVMTKM